MNLFQMLKSNSKKDTPKEVLTEQSLVEAVDMEKPEKVETVESIRPNTSYKITLETVSKPDPDNPGEMLWEVTARHSIFAAVGIGATYLKAKRNLCRQLKNIEKFCRVAEVMVGTRTGKYSCNLEFKNGEDSKED